MDLDLWLDRLTRVRVDQAAIADWSVHASESTRLTLGVKDRHAGDVHAPLNLADGVGARYLVVWDDGRISRGFLERDQLDRDPSFAMSRARAAAYEDADAARVHGPAELPMVDLFDGATARTAAGDPEPFANRLGAVRRRVADESIGTWSGSFSASRTRSRLVTSSGMDARSDGTSSGWHVSLDGEIGDGFAARRPEPDEDFEARLERLTGTLRALKQTAAAPTPGIRTVILHPRVVESFVLGTLLHNLGGAAVAHGNGHFGREQFGSTEPVLRADLTLRLDPLEPLRSGSYRFTSEGIPAAKCSYVERGRLVTPLLDMKYARRLGRKPTPLPVSFDALRFTGSTSLPRDEAARRTDGGALVLSVLGVHTQDRTSGDFSLSAPQSLRLGPNGPEGRIRATISGNLFDVLRDPALEFVDFELERTPGLMFPCHVGP